MDSYSVILKNHDEERLKITAFLKNYYSLDDEEVLAFLKNSPGFLIENKTIEKAEEVYKKAQKQNLQTLIIDDKKIPDITNPMSFVEMELKDSGFFFISKSVKEYVNFESIKMITVGMIREENPKNFINDITLEVHEKTEKLLNLEKTKENKEKELIFYMDIFLNKEPLRLRLTHPNFDYSFLGKEKLYSSIENFKLLLDEIATGAPKAFKNKTTDTILNKEPLSNFIYDDIDAYEKEIVWLNIVSPQK